jgi:transcriptional regulator with XRE-family HTH domain
MIPITEVDAMETKDVILELRTKRGLSQDDLAEKVMVTRQAVSRWENGDTVPNTDTLKLLSKEFDIDKHSAWRTEEADMSVLWNAA